jgi:Rrf2 family protein
MLCLSKKTEYALIALGYLAERSGQVASAREIGQAFDLPIPLLMNILKSLNKNDLLTSSRGIKGGYQIGPGLLTASLYDLIAILDGDQPAPLVEVHQDEQGTEQDDAKLIDLVMPKRSQTNNEPTFAVSAMA